MASTKANFWLLIFCLVLGGLTGSALSQVLKLLAPWEVLHRLLVIGPQIGLDPPVRIDVEFMSLTLGFSMRLNLLMALGMFSGLLLSRKF